jgi:hypothetical protein
MHDSTSVMGGYCARKQTNRQCPQQHSTLVQLNPTKSTRSSCTPVWTMRCGGDAMTSDADLEAEVLGESRGGCCCRLPSSNHWRHRLADNLGDNPDADPDQRAVDVGCARLLQLQPSFDLRAAAVPLIWVCWCWCCWFIVVVFSRCCCGAIVQCC